MDMGAPSPPDPTIPGDFTTNQAGGREGAGPTSEDPLLVLNGVILEGDDGQDYRQYGRGTVISLAGMIAREGRAPRAKTLMISQQEGPVEMGTLARCGASMAAPTPRGELGGHTVQVHGRHQ